MKKRKLSLFVAAIMTTAFFGSSPQRVEAYQVDCAILLCLAGGWPPSVPCAHARAVFIQRATPWPVTPPLQIWRCPLGVSSEEDLKSPSQQLYDLAFKNAPPLMLSYPEDEFFFDTFRTDGNANDLVIDASIKPLGTTEATTTASFDSLLANEHIDQAQLWKIQDRADIDISGSTYDFVRSIRVWHLEQWHHMESNRTGDCTLRYNARLGTYGTQGDYRWERLRTRGQIMATPDWVIPDKTCRDGNQRRGVGVEWRDYEGNHEFEWISY